MKFGADLEAVLGATARRSDLEWELADAESARLAVSIALERRAPLSPGFPSPGRTGLRPVAGILTLWRDELVARVGAGTTVGELEKLLAVHGLTLGLDVPDPGRTTLGACYACGRAGFAGPRGISLRDRTVGLSFVDGRARLLAAGARVVKNVAGYDFGRLHHGARGSLGLILDITVRLVARPERQLAVWWACRHDELPARLPEIRAWWGNDAAAEILVDRVAAVRYGLPGPGIVFRQGGAAELLESRILRSDAVDVSARWSALLARSTAPARLGGPSMLSVQDPGEDWVADLGNGLLRKLDQAVPESSPPSAAALAIKHVFDPHGIWPDLPLQEGVR
jgi:hypothetical protein